MALSVPPPPTPLPVPGKRISAHPFALSPPETNDCDLENKMPGQWDPLALPQLHQGDREAGSQDPVLRLECNTRCTPHVQRSEGISVTAV